MMHVYLAGPEVFLPGGRDLIDRKRAMLAEFGFAPTPRHAEFTVPEAMDARARGELISRLNEELMDGADLCVANLTPFRGISADVGTVFEVGYMIAQGKPAYGFTNEARDYGERAAAYLGGTRVDEAGSAGEEMVEQHGMSDNLMIDGGIVRRGGAVVRPQSPPSDVWSDLETFRRALAIARERLDA